MQKTFPNSTSPFLIAPCGIDCRLCMAYGRDKKACPGCRGDDSVKAKSCLACKMKNCEKRLAGKMEYCFECDEFPCALVKHIDKRYRGKYGTSPIANLVRIQEIGIQVYVLEEDRKWACPGCGAMLCMHYPQCRSCGFVWNQ
jgi:hypothetical protein